MVGLDAAHGIDLVDFARVLAGSRRAEDGPALGVVLAVPEVGGPAGDVGERRRVRA